jgi:polar amino acid transport system ATP-binding protein
MGKIKIKNLKKTFGELEVLKDINLEIKEKEVVCIIGPSGSGKSTLLRCINALEEATSGTVEVDGNDITGAHEKINLFRQNIGMVFQQFGTHGFKNKKQE